MMETVVIVACDFPGCRNVHVGKDGYRVREVQHEIKKLGWMQQRRSLLAGNKLISLCPKHDGWGEAVEEIKKIDTMVYEVAHLDWQHRSYADMVDTITRLASSYPDDAIPLLLDLQKIITTGPYVEVVNRLVERYVPAA